MMVDVIQPGSMPDPADLRAMTVLVGGDLSDRQDRDLEAHIRDIGLLRLSRAAASTSTGLGTAQPLSAQR